jgi:hypothetical protein
MADFPLARTPEDAVRMFQGSFQGLYAEPLEEQGFEWEAG